jgi:mono/diheme cytochrome c family protein
MVNRSWGVARAGGVALALAIAAGMSSRVLAADEIDDALSTAGKVWYEKYCMPCHGQGGAPGDAVYRATKERVNLRTYVQRHGGKFPANDWLAVIADIKRHPRRAALSSSEDDAAVSRP